VSAAAVFLLLVQPITFLSSATVILLAAWWSAGGDPSAAIGLYDRRVRGVPVDTDMIVLVDRLEQVVVPAFVLVLLVGVNDLVRRAMRPASERGQRAIDRVRANIRRRVADWRR
jgi:type IV secretory pathway protease TraF